MNCKDLIDSILKGVSADVVKDQISKGIRASGKSADSLKTESEAAEGDLKGSAHIYFQIHGRKPGPFRDGIKTIMAWLEDKGIKPIDISLKSLAFLIVRKIQQRGNDIFMGRRPALAFSEIVTKWKKILVERFIQQLKQEVHGAISSGKA